jgi:hypothetical protein
MGLRPKEAEARVRMTGRIGRCHGRYRYSDRRYIMLYLGILQSELLLLS